MRRSCSLIVLLAVLIAGAGPARAAFPGRDGLLAVQPVSGAGIVIARPGGSVIARICTDTVLCGRPRHPRFSPDGRGIVFAVAGRPGAGIVAPDGTCLWCLLSRPLTTGPAADPVFGPHHTVDFIRNGTVQRISLGAGAATVRRGAITDIAVSASGREALVRHGAIWLRAGRRWRRLVTGSSPSWSADGRRIAYAVRSGVWIVGVAGRAPRRVAAGSAPAFAPDGRTVAYVTPGHRIATVAVSGRHRHVTGTRGVSVDWQPAVGAVPAGCANANGTIVTADGQGAVRQAIGRAQGLGPIAGWNGCLNLLGEDHHLMGGEFGGCYADVGLGRAIVAGRFAALQFNFCDHDGGCLTRIDTDDLSHPSAPDAGYSTAADSACASTVDQLAADSSGFTAWHETVPAPRVPINPPSCPSAGLCVAGDAHGSVLTSSDPAGGRDAWTIGSTSQLFAGVQLVSCPSTAFCAATAGTNAVLISTDPGAGAAGWRTVALPTRSSYPGISCPSASFCALAGFNGQVITSTDPAGPAPNWTVVPYGGRDYPQSIACASERLCVVSDNTGHIYASTDPAAANATWSGGSVTGSFVTSLTCPSESFCAAASGGQLLTSTDPAGGPSTWTATSLGPAHGLRSVSCPADNLCVATDGTDVLTSTSPGAGASAWASGTVDPGGALSAVGCAPAGLCLVAGANGEIAGSTEPGAGAPSYRIAAVDGAPCLRDPHCVTEQLYAHDDAGARIVDTATGVGGGEIADVGLDGNATTLTWTHDGQAQSLGLR